MATTRRVREPLTSIPTADYWERKAADGWRPVAIELERSDDGTATAPVPVDVPYGLRVADDCRSLEENPQEAEALTLMLRLIADDSPLSGVASELNRRGFRDRRGGEWTQVAVFEMLPRLVEAAPDIYRGPAWAARRQAS